jgi:hypothetical protein
VNVVEIILCKITTVIDEEILLLIRRCKKVMKRGFRVEGVSLNLMVWSGMHWGLHTQHSNGVIPSR